MPSDWDSFCHFKLCRPNARGVLLGVLGAGARPVLQILTLFQTKKRELEPLVSCPPSFLELASKKLSHYYLQKDTNKKIS